VTKQREHWSSQLGFVLAAAGSAIGLGTLWKFPYVTGQNGGGIFVLTYIACIFLIGIPIFIAELVIGRNAQRGAVGTFASLTNNSPLWQGVGWLGVAASFLIMSYYSVVAGWGINYLLMSLNQFYLGKSNQEISAVFDLLSHSADITLFWHAIFTAITVALVYPGINKGIEYWSKLMTTGLLLLLVGLCIFSCTLDGFFPALRFLFSPNLENFSASSALEALGLAFFTLSLGQGIMITYGSYMRHSEDIPKTGVIIGTMIILASLLAGLMIFPVIFSFGFAPESGPGLVFRTLPVLFSKLPASLLISTLFFLMFSFTALTSAIALIEVVAANFIDLLGWSRRKAVISTGIGCFLFGIPSALAESNTLFSNWTAIYGINFFDTIDNLVSVWLLPLGGLLISIYVGWILDKRIQKEEFFAGTTMGWLFRPWIFFLKWVAPCAIALIICQRSGLIDIDSLLARS
jgi:NSS family neurotransmitter:Na+ symporter